MNQQYSRGNGYSDRDPRGNQYGNPASRTSSPRQAGTRQVSNGRPPQGPRPAANTMQTTVRRGSARPQYPHKKKKSSVGRNLVLFGVLLFLVAAVLVITLIQSGNEKTKDDYVSKNKNTVMLSKDTTSPEDAVNEKFPVYAEYTDESKALSIKSDYGILIDLNTNKVLASKNGDAKIYPASMTKVMTLIVAYENAKSLDDTFTFTSELLDPLYAANASQAGFASGESVKIRDMLYGCALPSGADATIGLACYVAGSEENFADLMNSKVQELGLKNTHFVTVSGLHDDNHYSTCHDIALILEYAISDPYLRSILSTYKYTTSPTEKHPEGITLTSTLYSRMAGDEAKGLFVQGGKTGYTDEALNCLATFAARCTEEMASSVRPEYLLVTAHASGEYTPVHDAISAYGTFCGEEEG